MFALYQRTVFPWNQKRNIEWWKYLLLALADVEATFLVVMAYRYTNLSSIILLTSFTTPCTMVLSMIFLKKRYRWNHYLGVFICLFGTAFLVIFDYYFSESSTFTSTQMITGNILVIVSSFLYSISNIGCEYVMRNDASSIQNSLEYFSSFGFFAFVINALQTIILESKTLYVTKWSPFVFIYLFSYGFAMFFTISLIPHVVNYTSATFLNLSFLTQNIYSIIIDFFILKKIPRWYYYVSFVFITSGIIIYYILPELSATQPKTDQREETPIKEEQKENNPDQNEIQNTNQSNL